MTVEVKVSWDNTLGIAFVTHVALNIASAEDVDAWLAELIPQFEAIRSRVGGKFPVVVSFAETTIGVSVAKLYGDIVKERLTEYASVTGRWGPPAMVRQIVAAEALRSGFRANLFNSREEAIRYVLDSRRRSRSGQIPKASSG